VQVQPLLLSDQSVPLGDTVGRKVLMDGRWWLVVAVTPKDTDAIVVIENDRAYFTLEQTK
jgi:hypothetical protein